MLKTAEADAAGMADLKLANIPVKITGTMSDPTIRPDLSGLALGRVKEQIEAKKDVIKEKGEGPAEGIFEPVGGGLPSQLSSRLPRLAGFHACSLEPP